MNDIKLLFYAFLVRLMPRKLVAMAIVHYTQDANQTALELFANLTQAPKESA